MYKSIFIWLSRLLYPKGRAFKMPFPQVTGGEYVTEDGGEWYTTEDGDTLITEGSEVSGGILHRVHDAVGSVQSQVWEDAISTLDSAIADNPNFGIDDANAWYRRLGIYNSLTVPLPEMMQAINQKINYPGEFVYGRSHYQFIQDQLQLAGFNVYVYENRFLPGPVTKTPAQILGSILSAMSGAGMSGAVRCGQRLLSHHTITKVANYIEESKDAPFDIGSNYRSTFYITGATVDTFAEVPSNRRIEFRALLLQLKPANTCGICFIDYV